MDNMKILARLITDNIFSLGCEPHSPVNRVQFLGGDYPDKETPQGGVCREAFESYVLGSIQKFSKRKELEIERLKTELSFVTKLSAPDKTEECLPKTEKCQHPRASLKTDEMGVESCTKCRTYWD